MRISIQSGNLLEQFGIDRGYEMIAKAGFEGIDWNVDHAISPAQIRKLQYQGNCVFELSLEEVIASFQAEIDAIHKYNLDFCQAHSIFPAYVVGHPELIDWSVEINKRAIELMDSVGCPYLVVHGISEGDKNNDELNFRLYDPLAKFLKDKKTVVCLENLFTNDYRGHYQGTCCNPEQAARYIDRLNDLAGRRAFALCVDTGHLNLFGINPYDYITTVGDRIGAFHIHDNSGNGDAHLAPFAGTVKWNLFIDALRDIRYRGDLNFETFAQTDKFFAHNPDLVMPALKEMKEIADTFRREVLA